MNNYAKKYKGNIAVTIILFIFAFIFFSICAIDAGYVITTRYKSQKITETLALYMVSKLKTLPKEERTLESLDDIKEKFQNLYTNLDEYYKFEISDIQLKDTDTNPKIKLITTTYTPTLFLKYAGIGLIKVLQTSYAKSEEYDMPLFEFDENSYTYKTNDIITDKNGDDIKINFDNDYFIFAGIEDDGKNLHWAEIGSMTEGPKTKFQISNNGKDYTAYCINQGESTFDFPKNPMSSIGLAKYIKIYKAKCNDTEATLDESTTTPDIETAQDDTTEAGTPEETTDEPVVTILNSVKLIKGNSF